MVNADDEKVNEQATAVWRVLTIGGVSPNRRSINLKALGFEYRVSDEALAEIRANEERAAKVLTTAHKYLFR